MADYIELGTSEIVASSGNKIIKTCGIGSCVVITMYDELNKIGGMSHSMLPTAPNKNAGLSNHINKDPRYVDDAIMLLLESLTKLGSKEEYLIAKLIGGAKMFTILNSTNCIGDQNIKIAKAVLNQLNIPIVSQDVGGSVGRTAEFNLNNGLVSIKTKA